MQGSSKDIQGDHKGRPYAGAENTFHQTRHGEERSAVAIPYGFRKTLGIATPVCALARNDVILLFRQ